MLNSLKILPVVLLLISCSQEEKKGTNLFTGYSARIEDWTIYEGKWKTQEGLLRIELYLKEASPGIDPEFKLFEYLTTKNIGRGAPTNGKYSLFYGLPNGETGIRLNNLPPTNVSSHFRQSKSWLFDSDEEMYFISRGESELLPSDETFEPYSSEKKFALTKRFSKLFTVEGYFTFTAGSAEFFERNTGEKWILSSFGEYDTLQSMYAQLAKEKFEGIYLKGLAYVGRDDGMRIEDNRLVIKRVLSIGEDK